MIITSGCTKKKNSTSSIKTTTTKKSNHKKSSFDENLEAFALDDDALHNFAHDKDTKSSSTDMVNPHNSNVLFEWENATVDQSKQDFKTIYFGFDKYNIDKNQQASLEADIAHAKKMIEIDKIIVIEGHACDSAGSAIYNMTLSEQRAKFIATQFMNAGIEKDNIKIAARGQEMPIVKGGNRHQQAVNRRVEVFAIDSK